MISIKKIISSQIQNTANMRRAIRLVWKSSPKLTIFNLVLLIIEGILPLVSLYLMKLMLDAVSTALTTADHDAAFGQVAIVILLAGVVTAVTYLISTIGNVVTAEQGRLVSDYMNNIIHAKSIEVDLEYYENATYYDSLHRAQQEAPYRPLVIVNSLAQILQNAVSLVGVGWILLSFHWGLALLLLIAVLPSMFVRIRFSRIAYNLQRKHTPEDRRAWYFQQLLTAQTYAKEIRIFDLGPTFIKGYSAIRVVLRKIRLELDLRRSVFEFLAQAIATAAVFGGYAYVAYRTIHGNLTLGDLVMFYQAFQRGQGFLQAFLNSIAGLYENTLFISNLYEFLDIQRKVAEPEHPVPVPSPMKEGIVFEHMSFHYPDSGRPALEDINLSIKPGEVIALVGENGSGKTTLIKLLCRLYDPDAGSITIDGINLRCFSSENLRREISVIFQDYAHYNLSAAENIAFGSIQRAPDREEIVAAAKHAEAHEVISNLPEGYDTMLGKLFENGEELSIGQWQKIALARAFLRDSQVIVLDEPTSAMDPKAEYEVFKKFRELLEGRSAILISHRLSTVRMADRVYVMEHGRIVESGSHDELVSHNGQYANLFETQAQYYR